MFLLNDLPVAGKQLFVIYVFVPKALEQKNTTPKCTIRAINGKQQAFDVGKLHTQTKAQDSLGLVK